MDRDKFAVKVHTRQRPATRRGLLILIISIYDPLGFIAPFFIKAKIIFQDECRQGKSWDDPLPSQNAITWKNWPEELEYLKDFSVDRCYGSAKEIQLHTFCDASQLAYDTVSYLRINDHEGRHRCSSFIMGRARLALLKKLTMPHHELCAAVLAMQISHSIAGKLNAPIREVCFWMDSVLVL